MDIVPLKRRIKKLQRSSITLFKDVDFFVKKKLREINKVEFVDFSEAAEKYINVKPHTIEEIEMPQIMDFTERGSFLVDYPEINIWHFRNARVFHRSDFIQISKDKIVWPKRKFFNFSKNSVLDYFMYRYDYREGYILKPSKVHVVDSAFSLIGVHSDVWSHSVWEYIPKLFQIRKVVAKIGKRITVLVPDYGESHLKKIVYGELDKLNVDILIVREGEAVDVKDLYFMERAARSTDDEYYVAIGDFTQPKMNSDIWKEYISKPLIEQYVEDKEKEPELKLYLARRNGGFRMMTNNDEIEKYYKERGYIFVEPHKISLKEVINLFYHAKIVAGPFSSAFTNLLFSRPGTKAFIMCNYTRAFENFLEPFQQYYGIDIKWLLGFDVDRKHPNHSSFYVPMERMIEACEKYGIN